MRHIALYTIIACLLSPGWAPAQSITRYGCVVTVSGDSLCGQITLKKRRISPTGLTLRRSDGSMEWFPVSEVNEFWMDDYGQFVAASVDVDIRTRVFYMPINLANDHYRTERVFLRRLVDGPLAGLYHFVDEEEHFYYNMSWDRSEFFELEYTTGFDSETGEEIIERNSFRYNLRDLEEELSLTDQPPLWVNVDFRFEDLTDYFRKINQVEGPLTYDVKQEKHSPDPAYFYSYHLGIPLMRAVAMQPVDRTGLLPNKPQPGFHLQVTQHHPLPFWQRRVSLLADARLAFGDYTLYALDTMQAPIRPERFFEATSLEISLGMGLGITPITQGKFTATFAGLTRLTGTFATYAPRFQAKKIATLAPEEAMMKKLRLAYEIRCSLPVGKGASLEIGRVWSPKTIYFMANWYRQEIYYLGLVYRK